MIEVKVNNLNEQRISPYWHKDSELLAKHETVFEGILDKME